MAYPGQRATSYAEQDISVLPFWHHHLSTGHFGAGTFFGNRMFRQRLVALDTVCNGNGTHAV